MKIKFLLGEKKKKMKQSAAFGIIAVLVSAMLLASLPAASAKLYGDANGDGIINMQDVTYVKLIIFGKKSANDYADTNQDGKINVGDVIQIKLIILEKVPFGRVVIPIGAFSKGTGSVFMKGNILNIGRAPTASIAYEGLVTKTRGGGYDGWLAESWEVSGDAKVWTFHLVKNAKWHDGEPFTSEDVIFTHDYLKSKKLWLSSVLSRVDHIECPDDYTAVFYMKTSYPVFTDSLSHTPGIAIIPKHLWKSIDDPENYVDEEFIGTGPFKLVNKIPEQYVKLEANGNYHGDKPQVREVVFKVITSKDSQILALKSGEVDVVNDISPVIADSLEGTKDIEVYPLPDTKGYEVGFNIKNYPSNIKAFRKAMAHAIDREKICNIVFGGYARPTYTTFLMPSVAHDFVDQDTPKYDYDLAETKRLLKSAEFSDTDGDGILEGPDGKDVTITIPVGGTAAAASGIDNKIAAILKNDWKELGIEVTIKQVDTQQWKKEVHKNPVFIVGMPYLMHDDPDDLAQFGSKAFFEKANWYDYDNPEYDKLIKEERSTADREERKEIGYKMQEILANDVPTVPICSADTMIAYRSDRFVGWEDIYPLYWDADMKILMEIKSAAIR